MGAQTFMDDASGKDAADAFHNVTSEALHEYGHGGYTGTIAEKSSFVMIECPPGIDPHDYAQQLINKDDPRISDKWGPAGCIDLGDGEYLFFGWASS